MLQSLVQPVAHGVSAPGSIGQIQRSINLLKSKGTDAHLWDFSTLTNLYQDSAGTTPVTAPDQPIGLVLDSLGVLGSELVTNGDFSNGTTGWATAVAGTTASVTAGRVYVSGISSTARLQQSVTLTVGKTYLLRCSIYQGATPNGTQCIMDNVQGGTTGGVYGESLQVVFVCTVSALQVWLRVNAGDGYFDNVSLKEITGIHASQATSAKKPTLRRGLVNRLTYSGDLSNAAWSKTNITQTAGATDPYGGTSAFSMLETVVTGGHNPSSLVTVTSGVAYTQAAIVKANGRDYIGMYCNSPGVGKFFDISNGTVLGDMLGAPSAASIATLGGGWFLVAVSATTNSTGTGVNIYASTNGTTFSYAGDITKGFFIYRAALFTGTLTAQQILDAGGIPLTTSAPASSTQGRYWAEFDGVDDCLTLGSAVGATNEFSLVSAMRYTTLSTQVLYDEGVNGLRTYAVTDGSVDSNKNGVSAYSVAPAGTLIAGTTTVITSRLSGGYGSTRKNGSVVDSRASALVGAGTSAAYIGSGNPSGFYMNGSVTSVAAVKATLSDAELLLIEKLAANKAGVQI